MNELSLFAGVGGSILGGILNGHTIVGAVEYDAFRIGILLARQNDGSLPPFPIWDDVRTFDGLPWRGIVDFISAGFPCQDVAAGGTCEGLSGERSGLYREGIRIIGEVRPRYVQLENSPFITFRGLEYVLSDLALLGYDAQWGMLSAENAGANHKRKRFWLVASDPNQNGQKGSDNRYDAASGEEAHRIPSLLASPPFPIRADDVPAPHVLRGGNGIPHQLDAVSALGDAQVPAVVRLAWETLSGK